MNTVAELDLSNKTWHERWKQVREDFWGDLKTQTLQAVQRLLESALDIEAQDMIGSPRWSRVPGRKYSRNGFYLRTLLTSVGFIPSLKVPRIRDGVLRFRSLVSYKRISPDVDQGVLKMFLAGVSTRRVQEVLAPLLGGGSVSAQGVSRIVRVLDEEVGRFHARPLNDVYRYLILDGVYLKAKSPVSVKRRCVLVAYGIREDGVRELIDFQLASHGESQTAWELFLTRLKERGLIGKSLKLAVVDGNKGLWNALDLVWLGLPRQRCWAHKLRNVADRLPRKIQKLCTHDAVGIYAAGSYAEALRAFRHWKKVWNPIAPEAVDCLERDLDDMLAFYRVCPKEMWVKLRTTNVIERVFREVRRRTRPMSCFQSTDSVERIIYAIFHRQNNLWREKPLEITQSS